jgi:hypothetical protein
MSRIVIYILKPFSYLVEHKKLVRSFVITTPEVLRRVRSGVRMTRVVRKLIFYIIFSTD